MAQQFGVWHGQPRSAQQLFRQPMAELRIWNGNVHLIPADRRLQMAMQFEQLSIETWDRLTPKERQNWLDAVDWLNRTIQQFKLEDAGV